MLRFRSRLYFFAFMYSINAVIDISSESSNEAVLNSIFVVVASSFSFFSMTSTEARDDENYAKNENGNSNPNY